MLPAYYNHVRAFENTLVTKFFGLHCVKLTGAIQRKVSILVFYTMASFMSFFNNLNLPSDSSGPLCNNGEFILH